MPKRLVAVVLARAGKQSDFDFAERVAFAHVIDATAVHDHSFRSTVPKSVIDQRRVVSNVERHDREAAVKTGDIQCDEFRAVRQ